MSERRIRIEGVLEAPGDTVVQFMRGETYLTIVPPIDGPVRLKIRLEAEPYEAEAAALITLVQGSWVKWDRGEQTK